MRHSGTSWIAAKNSSWSEGHKLNHGDKEGFVICYKNKHNELIALASVIGQPSVKAEEIEGNAKVIAAAPELLRFAQTMAKHELGSAPSAGYFEELILLARKTLKSLAP